MRLVTAGHAVKAMVLNAWDSSTSRSLDSSPRPFQRAISTMTRSDVPWIRLYDYGVTELYSLIAATAAKRLGLTPTFTHLDSTSFHVDGRYNSEEASDDHVVHITQGYSWDHRPGLNQVMLELIVEHQAGIPVLMQPLSGNSSDAKAFGQVVSALYSADNLQMLAEAQMQWITRIPATLGEAQAVLAQANSQAMTPLREGYRYAVLASSYGGVVQHWVLIYSEHRQPQAQRTVDQQWLKQSDHEIKAFKTLCRTAFACKADAKQALARFVAGLQATFLHDSTVCPTPRYRKRGRSGTGAQPDQLVYHIAGALASRLMDRRARGDQQSRHNTAKLAQSRCRYIGSEALEKCYNVHWDFFVG
jgi:hypothetical protein